MEEDNASDINKFIGSQEAGNRAEATVTVKDRTFRAKVRPFCIVLNRD